MANVIKPKRSSVAGNTPTTLNLASGEIGVNMADQKIWINNGTSVIQIGAGSFSGLSGIPSTINGYGITDAVAKAAGGSILETPNSISANYTMTSGSNGMSAGPISVASGVTVTIPSGSVWTIV